jgi:signal transduction histidine kinase
MRLALKLAVAVMIGIGAILAVQAALHVKRVAELQEAEIKDNLITLGRALSYAVGEVWTLGGKERALAYVEKADARREQTKIRLILGADLQQMSEFSSGPRVERLSTAEGSCIVATAPVRAGDRTVGVLSIERRLPSEREYFASILWTQVGTTVAAAVLSGLIALLLGAWLVGRPIRKLSDLARRVADGDFSLRSGVVQDDEIGNLAREFDAMTDRLASSHERFRSERRARTEALEKLRHADRLSTVGRLASSVAHELGTPLNIVSGRATMIASDESLPLEPRENAQSIAEQAQRMTGIIREILDFSRRKPLEKKETRVDDVLEHAVALLEPILEDKNVVIEFRGVRDAVIPIDAGKVLQVVTNLLMNAIHAMPNGGKVTLSAEPEYVTDPKDRHASEGDFVKITVQDEGVGISEEMLENIFEAFFTTKKEGAGTGLGLSVCHGIVREHGGWIDVESEVGRGTAFAVHLPVKEDS